MKLLNESLVLPKSYSLTVEAQSYVSGLLLEADSVALPIQGVSGQAAAVRMGQAMRRYVSEVEQTRKQLKEPLLQASRMLDDTAKQAVNPLLAKIAALESALAEFQKQEQARIEAEQVARQAEIDRLAQVRLAAEHALEDAPEPDKAGLEVALDTAEAAERQLIIAPVPVAEKPSGLSTSEKLGWECTDVLKLFAARPDLCRLEPNALAIRNKCWPGMAIPGLRLWKEAKATISKARKSKWSPQTKRTMSKVHPALENAAEGKQGTKQANTGAM